MLSRRLMLQATCGVSVASLASPAFSEPSAPSPTSTGELPLTEAEFTLIAAMVEGIIPATDTPGAIGAGVPDFFRVLFDEWFLQKEQIAFRASLKGYDDEAKQRFGMTFRECDAAKQAQLLEEWDAKAMKGGLFSTHPFAEFKKLTLHGYYTSRVGMEEELGSTMGAALDDPNGPIMYFPGIGI